MHATRTPGMGLGPGLEPRWQGPGRRVSRRCRGFWDVEMAKEQAIIQSTGQSISSLTFSHDGKLLAVGTWYGSVRLYDLPGNTERAVLAGHVGSVWSVAFSPDDKLLASGCGMAFPTAKKAAAKTDGEIRLWNVASGAAAGDFPRARQESRIGCLQARRQNPRQRQYRPHSTSLGDRTALVVQDRGKSTTVPNSNCRPWRSMAFSTSTTVRLCTPSLRSRPRGTFPCSRLVGQAAGRETWSFRGERSPLE